MMAKYQTSGKRALSFLILIQCDSQPYGQRSGTFNFRASRVSI